MCGMLRMEVDRSALYLAHAPLGGNNVEGTHRLPILEGVATSSRCMTRTGACTNRVGDIALRHIDPHVAGERVSIADRRRRARLRFGQCARIAAIRVSDAAATHESRRWQEISAQRVE